MFTANQMVWCTALILLHWLCHSRSSLQAPLDLFWYCWSRSWWIGYQIVITGSLNWEAASDDAKSPPRYTLSASKGTSQQLCLVSGPFHNRKCGLKASWRFSRLFLFVRGGSGIFGRSTFWWSKKYYKNGRLANSLEDPPPLHFWWDPFPLK